LLKPHERTRAVAGEAIFTGTSKRPDEFVVKYTIDGQPFKETFKNQ